MSEATSAGASPTQHQRGQQDLQGRVAIVTGGARGIGEAITREFVARGASVVVADNGVAINGASPDTSIAQTLAASLGAQAVAFSEDISAPGAAARAVALAVERFGAVDIIVNNAAILKDSFIFKGNVEAYEEVLRNNLTGAYALLAAATPRMREQPKSGRAPGAVVNIASSAGIYGNFGQSAYASAKGGLIALSRIVAMDLQRAGITSNALAPFAATRVTDSIVPANDAQAAYKARALTVPARRVAQFVAQLAGPAGGGITGQLFGVRGREIMLFSQPRPIARVAMEGDNPLADALKMSMERAFSGHYTDLVTDLEAFNTDPVL
jgi:NAD(P)-dependent dehydrogenase (short-subunit alcohol dehydrogenase family)